MADELTKKLKWKEFYENVFRDREYCNTTCTVYTRCPLSITSKIMNKHPCRVKELDIDTQRRFVRLFIFGDDGLYDEVLSTIYDLSSILDLKHDKKDMILYIDTVLKFSRVFKGTIDMTTPQKLTINLEDYTKPVEIISSKGVVGEANIVMKRDPESLLDSPEVDRLFLKKENKEKIFT